MRSVGGGPRRAATTLHLASGLTLRRSLVAGAQGVELTGLSDQGVDQLKALG